MKEIKKLIKKKQGDSSIFQIMMCIGILTFLLFFPIITYSYFKLQNTIESISLDITQVASTRGGVDEEVIKLLVEELTSNGYDFDGEIIQQEDGNLASSVRVYTNVPLISSYELENGKQIKVEYISECSDTSSSELICNDKRRFRTNDDVNSKIKVKVVVPVSTYSSMLNNLYTLVTVRGNTDAVTTLDEDAGYVVSTSTLSELYDQDIEDVKAHTYGPWTITKEPTCSSVGTKVRVCSDCNKIDTATIAKLDHDYELTFTIDTPATCTSKGIKSRHCKNCSDARTDITEIPMLEHSYSSEYTIDREPTCMLEGEKSRHCTMCGNARTDITPIDKVSHNYRDEYTIDIPASCTSVGSKSKHCIYECGAKIDITSIPMTNHSFGDYTIVQEATCLATGIKTRTCAYCGYLETSVIEKKEHSYASTFTIDVQATCISVGSKSKHCTTPTCTAISEVTVIDKLSHTYSSTYTIDKEATCTSEGEKSKHCTTNGCTARTSVTSIAKLDHEYGAWQTILEPTCINVGKKQRFCANCDTSDEADIAMVAHTYASTYTIDVESTCTSVGSKSRHCTTPFCTSTTDVTEVAMIAHSYSSDYIVEVEPSCTLTGMKSKVCSVCGARKDTTSIPAKGHTSVYGGTSDVHTKCSVCGATLSSTHSYTSSVETSPTCQTKGTTRYTCECGYYYLEDNIDTVAHSYSNYKCIWCGKSQVVDWYYSYTGSVQTFTAPEDGTYTLKVWGAQGSSEGYAPGGYGGYATGKITLKANDTLYICVGGNGNNHYGYNGGGHTAGSENEYGYMSTYGGGATHIAKTTNRGELKNYNSYRSEVLIVAGGGGAAGHTSCGYTGGRGGSGGGTSGGRGYTIDDKYEDYDDDDDLIIGGVGGTQTSGYAFGLGSSVYSYYGGAGGGGWYGGKTAHNRCGGGGGSGYIGGVSSGSMSNGVRSGDGYVQITLSN